MTLTLKIKANALYIVISIALITAVILFGILLMAGVFSKANHNLSRIESLVLNNRSALEYALVSDHINEEKIDLFGDGKDSVLISRSLYGLLQQLHIKSFSGRDSVIKNYLIAPKLKIADATAIYLCNSNKALGVCGRTQLDGNITIPEKGIERVYIEGQNFVGSKLFTGKKNKSGTNLPELSPFVLQGINSIFSQNKGASFPLEKDTIINNLKTKTYLLEEDFILDKVIKGNIVIKSDYRIIVSKDAQLSNIILKAPSIIFENGFKGAVQAFATDSIIVGDNCFFTNPSALVLKINDVNSSQKKIILGQRSVFEGNIILLQDQFKLNNNGILTVMESCLVNGSLYSQAYTQLKSCKIAGNVFTKKLYLKSASSVYENTLLNVSINPALRDTNIFDLGISNNESVWLLLK